MELNREHPLNGDGPAAVIGDEHRKGLNRMKPKQSFMRQTDNRP